MVLFPIIVVVLVVCFGLWMWCALLEDINIRKEFVFLWCVLLVFTLIVGVFEYEYFKLTNECKQIEEVNDV